MYDQDGADLGYIRVKGFGETTVGLGLRLGLGYSFTNGAEVKR